MTSPGGISEGARELMRRAAEAGVENPGRLADCTLREIELELRAAEAQRRQQAEQADLLAWLVGRYVLAAVHAPRRYPARPNGIVRRPQQMTDAEMKRVFLDMVKERQVENGGC